jgi:hypothetical protein
VGGGGRDRSDTVYYTQRVERSRRNKKKSYKREEDNIPPVIEVDFRQACVKSLSSFVNPFLSASFPKLKL